MAGTTWRPAPARANPPPRRGGGPRAAAAALLLGLALGGAGGLAAGLRLGRPGPAAHGAEPRDDRERACLEASLRYANDPAAFEVVEWRRSAAVVGLSPAGAPCDGAVAAVLRARAADGVVRTVEAIYYLDGDRVVGVLNRPDAPARFDAELATLGLEPLP